VTIVKNWKQGTYEIPRFARNDRLEGFLSILLNVIRIKADDQPLALPVLIHK
jgi:hypothetical protein